MQEAGHNQLLFEILSSEVIRIVSKEYSVIEVFENRKGKCNLVLSL
jgi:hypothetical protein